MKISVIVPIYNVEKYLPKAMDSLLNQTHTDLTFILVDDGSTDSCPQLVDEYARQDDRVRVIHKPNGGLQSAYRAGIAAADSEYIGFVDSDDYVDYETFQIFSDLLDDYPADIAICNYRRHYEDGSVGIPNDPGIEEGLTLRQAGKDDLYLEKLRVFPPLIDIRTSGDMRCNKVFKKELFLRALHYCDASVSNGEDYQVVQCALMMSHSVYYKKACCYHYVQHGESIVHNFKPSYFNDFLNVCHALQSCADDNGIRAERLPETFFYLFIAIVLSKLRHGAYPQKEKVKLLRSYLNHDFVKTMLKQTRKVPKFRTWRIYHTLLSLHLTHVLLWF